MSISAGTLGFNEHAMRIDRRDGRAIGAPLAWLPRLLHATAEQRQAWRAGGDGLHWGDVEEDISVAGLLEGRGDPTRPPNA